jgi:Zn-dependent protease
VGPDNVIFRVATWLIPLVFAIVLHEISHGWAAYAFGDPTARRLGRLSPNPLRHVDPFGTLILPLVLAVSGAPVFGWAKPVPVVAQRMRRPRLHMMLVALAGPGMNLLLAVAAGAVLALFLRAAPSALFNLLPIPPFDGGHVVEGLLPRPLAARYAKLGRFGFPLLIFLLLILPMLIPGADVVGRVVRPPVEWLIGLILPAGLG